MAVALAICGCSPLGKVRDVAAVRAPAERKEARAAAAAAVAPVDAAAERARRMAQDLLRLREQLGSVRAEAQAFEARVVQERAKGLDTKAELELVWKQLRSSQTNLFTQLGLVEELEQTNQQLESDLAAARIAVREAVEVAALKDAEAGELRAGLAEANRRIAASEADKVALRQEGEKWRSKYDGAKVYKRWAIALGIAAVLLLVGLAVLEYLRRTAIPSIA